MFLFILKTDPRKHWLLEDNTAALDSEGGFINRHGPFQSSLNEGKHKRAKKPSLLRGIGHMFRFGKHRKDGIVPTETISESGSMHPASSAQITMQKEIPSHSNKANLATLNDRVRNGPPNYQPPPPVTAGLPIGAHPAAGIQQNDVFNHRYSHYVNYEELQQQIRYECMVYL